MKQQGSFIQQDFFNNVGGANLTDSPFVVRPEQATGGANYDYTRTGGFVKRLGIDAINSVADAQLKTIGLGLLHTKDDVRTTIRAAGTKLQNTVVTAGTFTDLTEDTSTATSDFLSVNSSNPVLFNGFGTTTTDVLWATGGGMDAIYGAYSPTKVTKNGVDAPEGVITATPSGAGGGFGVGGGGSAGTYYYAVSYQKASTGAQSNVILDKVAVVGAGTDIVTINVSGLTNLDTTKFDKILIYRSAVGGASAFTTGTLVKTLDSTATSYADDGASDETGTINIPRSGSIILDNSTLPAGTYNLATIFKRRMVTAKGSTIYLSEVNKPESWPIFNYFQLPTGGAITALAIISFTTPTSATTDEFLVVFKENELWVISGTGALDANGIPDWSLKLVDTTGCVAPASIVTANGYLYFINRRGIFLWDGAGKPIYISRPIETLFGTDGQLDQTTLPQSWGVFNRKKNQIIWQLSHKTFGTLKYSLKLDLRLTLPSITQTSGERVIDGIFMQDNYDTALYAGSYQRYLGAADDIMLVGDDAGKVYQAYFTTNDDSAAIDFTYETTFLNLGTPGTRKQIHKVIVWVDKIGDWDLTLDYWSDYRTSETDLSSNSAAISTGKNNTTALWDVAFWDEASWDDFTSQLIPLAFHLRSPKNNAVGDCIKLRFKQQGADQPITISGFSIIYSEVGETR